MNKSYYTVGAPEGISPICPAGVGTVPSHKTGSPRWTYTYSTGQRGGIVDCACGAEWRVLEYAKVAKRRSR